MRQTDVVAFTTELRCQPSGTPTGNANDHPRPRPNNSRKTKTRRAERKIRVYVHAHLHHTYGVRDEFGRGEYCLEKGVLHISVGATANNRGSSVLYIAKDKIVAKVRDHAKRAWRDKFEFTMPVRTTLHGG